MDVSQPFEAVFGVPVTVDGRAVGILTNRDLRFERRLDVPVRDVMTSEGLVTVPPGTSLEDAKDLMQEHKIEKLLVVDGSGSLTGLITVKDIQKAIKFPLASKDDLGRLRVGAAVGVGAGTDERITALVEAGVDVIVVDTAHGHSKGVLDRVRWLKTSYPELDVIGGNIATGVIPGGAIGGAIGGGVGGGLGAAVGNVIGNAMYKKD